MFISEEEKREILSKYQDNTSDVFLRHLIRAYPVDSQKILDKVIHFITIDDKRKILTGNKDRKSKRLNSSQRCYSSAVFCLKNENK